MEDPILHDQAAHAFTFGAQFRRKAGSRHGFRHSIAADYLVREATADARERLPLHPAVRQRRLHAEHAAARISCSASRAATSTASRRSSSASRSATPTTLRGWDKFDVAPLGGTRLLYGSLEYRYRPFQLFYDFGTVWDRGQQAVDWKHSVGIGLAWKNGFFMSLGVPLRYHGVTPVFMIGFRL